MVIIEVVWSRNVGGRSSILYRDPSLVEETLDYYRSLLGTAVHSVRVVG